MRNTINTVCGPVAVEELGGVYAHEHFIWGWPGFQGDTVRSARMNKDDREAMLKRWLAIGENIKSHGIRTIVDATPNECGRDVSLLKEFSERSEINIIVVTGFYTASLGALGYFNFRRSNYDVVKEIEELMHEEYYNGIGDTGVKAGLIKVSSSYEEITDSELPFFTSAARIAAADKDVRIITHTSNGTCGPEQAKLLIDGGVDPRQIAIGHLEGSTDIDYLLNVAEQGVYLNCDRFGIENGGAPKDSRRIASVAALCAMGYGDKICISHDTNQDYFGRPYEGSEEDKKLTVNSHWLHIPTNVIPAMHKAGLSEAQTHAFLYENPHRFYGAF